MTCRICALPGARTEYAGMWRRNWASTVDTLLLVPVFLLVHLAVMAGTVGGLLQLPRPHTTQFWVYYSLQLLVPLVITAWFWAFRGATPGKQMMGLRVIDIQTGGNLRFDMAVLRYLGYIVSALPLGLGFLWSELDPQKQTWHDKMALSLVVYMPR